MLLDHSIGDPSSNSNLEVIPESSLPKWNCFSLKKNIGTDGRICIVPDKPCFPIKNKGISFSYFCMKICYGFLLEAPRPGTSNEYP